MVDDERLELLTSAIFLHQACSFCYSSYHGRLLSKHPYDYVTHIIHTKVKHKDEITAEMSGYFYRKRTCAIRIKGV